MRLDSIVTMPLKWKFFLINKGFFIRLMDMIQWWAAYINGMKVSIYRANVNFKAIGLPKGNNNISFVYDPFWFKASLIFFFGAFVVCIMG